MRHRTPGPLAATLAAVLALGAADARAASDDPATLRAELEAIKAAYEQRIAELEARIERLEEKSDLAGEPEDLAAIKAAARAAAGPDVPAPQAPTTASAVGRERNLNQLNPEISATGVVLATTASGRRDEFTLAATEVDIQSALDPFSRTRWVIGFGDEGVEIEEGYVSYSSLPGGLELTAGKFKQRFGALNRQHLHALPQADYPLVLRTVFGEEGLAQTGLSFTWLLPRPWASANEITLEVTDGENEEAFGGEDFEDLAVLGKLKNFFELDAARWIEWGLSGVAGKTAEGGTSRVLGTDVTIHWQPPARAKYRELTWRTELLLAEREDPFGIEREAWGGYSYIEGLLKRNLSAGLRLDRAEDPLAPEDYSWGVVPYLTWWQSEYVRLRGEYGYEKNEATGESEDRFTLQLTWAAGPHKHETY
jgi:hypothetical protein